MSSEYKDWLSDMKSLSSEDVIEEACISYEIWAETPFERLNLYEGASNSVAVYFAFEKLVHELAQKDIFNKETLLDTIRRVRDKECNRKDSEEEIKKRLCPKCRESEVGTFRIKER